MENCFSLASLNNKQSTWADDGAFKCLLFRALSAKFVFSSLMKSPCSYSTQGSQSSPAALLRARCVRCRAAAWGTASSTGH